LGFCLALFISLASITLTAGIPARADEPFYRGKTITLLIPIGPGGAYDTYARLVARHLNRHLPGNPTIVPRNMPGAGGGVASSYLYNVAPRDGTTLIVITSTFAIDQLLHNSQVKYDGRRMPAIGRLLDTRSVLFFWHQSAIKTVRDLFTTPSTIAASTLNEVPAVRLRLMNRLLGTQMRLIPGYPSAKDFVLASERGETDGGATTFIGLRQLFASDLSERRLNIVLQFGADRDPALPDVPSLVELTRDTEAQQIFRFLVSGDDIGRSLLTTPDVPTAQLNQLRAAFGEMIKDPDFLAEAQRLNLPLAPKSGEELQQIITDTFKVSPQSLATIKISPRHDTARQRPFHSVTHESLRSTTYDDAFDPGEMLHRRRCKHHPCDGGIRARRCGWLFPRQDHVAHYSDRPRGRLRCLWPSGLTSSGEAVTRQSSDRGSEHARCRRRDRLQSLVQRRAAGRHHPGDRNFLLRQ
jgi:tripartite-type tricarboxylate transporter receptor subunit TctC